MDNLPDLAGKPRPLRVKIDGEIREYLIHPLTVDDLATLQAWVDSQFPDPFEAAARAIAKHDYTVAQQQYLMGEAMRQATAARRPIGTPEADRVLFGLEGSIRMLLLAIAKGDPSFAEDDARRLRMHLTLADLAALEAHTGIGVVTSDPKAPATTSGGSGSSTSPGPRRRPPRSGGGTSTTRP